MNKSLILSLLAGFFFGLWPVAARGSSLGSLWIALIIPLGTLLLVAMGALPVVAYQTIPATKMVLIGLAAGALNGLGMLAMGGVLANAELNVSKYVPIVAVVSIASAAIGAFIVFKEPVTLQKSLGLLCAVVAVWLLS